MPLLSAEIDERVEEGYHPVRLDSDRGTIEARFTPAPEGKGLKGDLAVIWVGGIGGGFDTPARGLYPRLAADLTQAGIASLRIRFRNPHDLEEAVYDVLCGLTFLGQQGIHHTALVGHSFGGAVVIQAAASNRGAVCTVVTLASQGFGADPVKDLACPILLIHGEADEILTPMCSIHVHRMAREPKKLVLMPGAGHCLDETAEAVCREVRDWLTEKLLAL
ncbi:alpha/beta hydrolase [Azospirillum rugosum]|uniref:Pimeloyl-ACP methyl ester carboxylesterase n=1 Tax=Azospirillum rugosum TaxID=416170 RepID=A0ABS4SQP2_9PROT|nr:alpha/beta hydrolase [Azospirillum rugosum]MBP2294887.1 pimeloyl-ACP methyl ester carboxylesterase [Azospirillum rugosum]MDQ0528191.1 pimeloyl-ACP methyl ester carboxylesterase [Azospirillum rugosum]